MLEIRNLKEANKGSLLANFDLYFPNMGMTIRNCSYFKKGSQDWIGMPSRKYEKDGETKYFSFVFWDKEWKEKLDTTVLPLIRDGLAFQHPVPAPQDTDHSSLPF